MFNLNLKIKNEIYYLTIIAKKTFKDKLLAKQVLNLMLNELRIADSDKI